MVDIHCHMLPGVDDGAKSWEITEQMIAVAVNDGIKHVVCTPHANDKYAYDRAALMLRMDELRARAAGRIEFSLGCDFHFSFENIQAALANPDDYVIERTDYLLVEFSDYSLPPSTADALRRFAGMGITPIITHPERNLLIQRSPEQVLRFIDAGCIVQVTANSLTGHWGDAARRMCKWLLERDAVHVVASDAHDPRFRPPVLSAARTIVADQCDEELADALFSKNPRAVVQNQPLPYLPEVGRG
jgi:protein-tyrosine phosphatase